MMSPDPEIMFFEGASGEDVITAHLLQEYHPEIAIAAKGTYLLSSFRMVLQQRSLNACTI